MPRSRTKGPFAPASIRKPVRAMKKAGSKQIIRTWARHCSIYPIMQNFTFAVHNGKSFIPVFVTQRMIKHKLGEFAPTRRFKSHTHREKKRKKN